MSITEEAANLYLEAERDLEAWAKRWVHRFREIAVEVSLPGLQEDLTDKLYWRVSDEAPAGFDEAMNARRDADKESP